MAESFVGEIRMFGGNFAPAGWSFCDGQLLAISEYETLFSLIGTTYGGDGQNTFAVPDLRGRVPVHQGLGFVMGQAAGTENVTLTVQQMPAHTHPGSGGASSGAATTASPAGAFPATPPSGLPYADTGTAKMAAGASSTLANVGGSGSHNNMMPSQCVNYIISLYGIYPSPT